MKVCVFFTPWHYRSRSDLTAILWGFLHLDEFSYTYFPLEAEWQIKLPCFTYRCHIYHDTQETLIKNKLWRTLWNLHEIIWNYHSKWNTHSCLRWPFVRMWYFSSQVEIRCLHSISFKVYNKQCISKTRSSLTSLLVMFPLKS